jgi:hypothetical protein
MSELRLLMGTALLALSGLVIPIDSHAITYTSFTHSSFAEKLPGADGLIGTADDVAAPGFNLAGTATFSEFNDVHPALGTNFTAFFSGTLALEEPLIVIGGEIVLDEFSISMTSTQTNAAITSTVVDLDSVLPHEIVFQIPGTWSTAYTLRSTNIVGTLEADVAFSGFTIVPGLDPFLLPGITASAASYLASLVPLAPAGWTSISLGIGPFTAMTTENIGGTLAPFFVGGMARGTAVFVTTDPIELVVPESGASLLVALAALSLGSIWMAGARRRP